ncbi:acyl-CoA reductase-like NAD-dependent aldehyde dehydrogenase [Actinocorallia herbida]|uniref:Acyl-CoA reductase-like NAD-dependent aldehyde dehydrogenase n=1 Tax=Actinocorallia herbida TaxID=58109 RepID=A0A3N1D177_9ACTN|nr:aldehyde dehydrogenase family protein [Actinocorallia herbida]ROO87279.1 acyl-CoA reductase-like NAD-dependent aldehyde dehydrogenase [Actinocorallia herbida]
MTDPCMTINGLPVPAKATFEVIDPATAEVFAQAPDCGREQLDLAMSSANAAFGQWRRDDDRRREALRSGAAELYADIERIAGLLTLEQGKPLEDARMEVMGAAYWLNHFADLKLAREIVQDDENGFAEVVRRPLGVVAAITPWNVPVTLAAWKIAPALRAGNTMVLKPSPYTPLSTLAMGEALARALPPGVLNVVSGLEPLGAQMTAHPVPRKVSFTGSTPTGMAIARTAADDLKRLTLELGGNDPAILLDDADPEVIAESLFWGAFANNGQVCLAVKRVYAPEGIYADVVEALAERARTVRVDAGTVDGARLGPINNRPQFDRVAGLVRDALAKGARAAAGGAPLDRPGYFFAPTILADVSEGLAIVEEEQFGPALPVIAYRDLDDVIAQANSGPYGLTASVWSPDIARARAVATELECGQVAINAHGTGARPDLPFGGVKHSGIGVENGVWGLHGFTDVQTVVSPAIPQR